MTDKLSKISGNRNVKIGAVLSYIFIVINALYGLAITPFIIGVLGEGEYGVYKTIASLSSSLMVLDLGLGGTVTRYLSKYIAEKEDRKIEPFISMALSEGGALIVLLAAVCLFIYSRIPAIYGAGLTLDEIALGQRLFVILSVNMCLHILENVLNGIIGGFNRFAFANGLKLARILLRIAFTIAILSFIGSAVVLVVLDLALTVFLIIGEYIFVKGKLDVKVRFSFKDWDKAVFRESFAYTGLLFLTSIAAQVNSNLDNVVIGAELGSAKVTVYSMGLVIFAMFENLSTAISGVMLPSVTNALAEDASRKKARDLVVSAGRVQFMLLGAAFCGFIVLGRDFIDLWLKDGFSDVYVIVLILMAPALLELCVNVCLSILRAENKLGFRTVVLSVSTLVNAVITIVGVRLYGYYAAAVGTGVSFLFGSVIVMNIYYHKTFGLTMLEIYREIMHGTWPCILLSSAAIFISSRLMENSLLTFIVNVLIFMAVYAVTMYAWGLNEKEKKALGFLNGIASKIKNAMSRDEGREA